MTLGFLYVELATDALKFLSQRMFGCSNRFKRAQQLVPTVGEILKSCLDPPVTKLNRRILLVGFMLKSGFYVSA